MKKTILWITAIFLLIASICVAGYPFISDYINNLNAQNEVVVYTNTVSAVDKDDCSEMLAAAREYNESLVGSSVITDPFNVDSGTPDGYESMLVLDGTDVMASIEIPKINLTLPIYHGTSDEILKKGAGHLAGSSLPVGGKGTHCILAGHTAESSLKLFSDVNQLENGDVFFITCLGEKLAYEVDQIKTVLPTDTDDLQIDPNADYVTLVTCTPFGVNTHRLLVRGTRVSLDEGEEAAKTQTSSESTWDNEYKKAIIAGVVILAAILLVFFAVRFIVKRVKTRKE